MLCQECINNCLHTRMVVLASWLGAKVRACAKHPLKCFRYNQRSIFSTRGRFCWFSKKSKLHALSPPLSFYALLALFILVLVKLNCVHSLAVKPCMLPEFTLLHGVYAGEKDW